MKDRNKLEQDFKESLKEQEIPYGFIKVTDNPVATLTSEQKVILNRRANEFFNKGNIEDARRIYITTGYSDGLTRVGDYFVNNNEPLKALKSYYLAHNKRDSAPIYESIAKVISTLIKDEK